MVPIRQFTFPGSQLSPGKSLSMAHVLFSPEKTTMPYTRSDSTAFS
jgi:hypothetical protein